MTDLDTKIIEELSKGEFLTVSQITERVHATKERIDFRLRQFRKWGTVSFKRVDVGARGRKPLAYIISTSSSGL